MKSSGAFLIFILKIGCSLDNYFEIGGSFGHSLKFLGDMFSAPKQNFPFPLIYSRFSLRFFSSLSLMKFQQRRHDLSGTNRLFFPSFLIFSCTFFHTDFKSRCNLSLPNRSRSVDLAVVSKRKTSII